MRSSSLVAIVVVPGLAESSSLFGPRLFSQSAGCTDADFPVDLTDNWCRGLGKADVDDAEGCAAACCSDSGCEVWQWCADAGGCSPQNSCWIGKANDCGYSGHKFTSRSRVEPYSKICTDEDFPVDMTDNWCKGLTGDPVTDAAGCAQACCSDTNCEVWQWCADTGDCNPPNSCWIGKANNCGNAGYKFTSRSRVPPYTPSYMHTRVLMTDFAQSTGAVCLDGSPGAFYFRPGSGDGTTKWYVHHEGGGWGSSLDDIIYRTTMDHGSSKGYPAGVTQTTGYFSQDPSANPLMHNWNSVFIRYCDGASFSGDNSETLEYKNRTLHFRGRHIREAVVATLLRDHALADATDVVISGDSAGGLATYLHTDDWCARIRAKQSVPSKCAGVPDSGFFVDYQNPAVPPTHEHGAGPPPRGDYRATMEWVYHMQNASGGAHQGCVAAMRPKGLDERRCFFAEHLMPFVAAPTFSLQCAYDSWQTDHVLTAEDSIQSLGDNITSRLQADLLNHPENGAYLDSCHHHTFFGVWNMVHVDGDSAMEALYKWYTTLGEAGAKTFWNQGVAFPCACPECHGEVSLTV